MEPETESVTRPGDGESTASQSGGSPTRPEFVSSYFHGTRADLKTGDLLAPGYTSNFGKRKQANFVYLSANLGAAIWGAELALGDDPERIYVVEPTGPLEGDPNLTDQKFPGNPTKSYRTREPVRIVGEVTNWQGHSPEALKAMKDNLERLKEQGIEHIDG